MPYVAVDRDETEYVYYSGQVMTLADLYEHRLNQPEPGPDWDGVDRKTSK